MRCRPSHMSVRLHHTLPKNVETSVDRRLHGGVESSEEVYDDLLQLSIRLVADLRLRADRVKDVLVGAADVSDELHLKLGDQRRVGLV